MHSSNRTFVKSLAHLTVVVATLAVHGDVALGQMATTSTYRPQQWVPQQPQRAANVALNVQGYQQASPTQVYPWTVPVAAYTQSHTGPYPQASHAAGPVSYDPAQMSGPFHGAPCAGGSCGAGSCSPPVIYGVDCRDSSGPCEPQWSAARPLPWQALAQGEYVGPARTAHVHEYRLRVDDQLDFVFRFTHEESASAYRFGVGDELIVESLTDVSLNRGDLVQGRGLTIQSDGTITLPLLGPIPVARRTVEEVRLDVEERYQRYYKEPSITITPLKTNTKLEELRDSVDGRFGRGGQGLRTRVTPEGSIQLPAVGSVPAQGLTLTELEHEVEERYQQQVGPGVEVTPVLTARAPTYVYVVGEVPNPGRYELVQPTTAIGAIALAGSWQIGGNVRQVVVFRRSADWCLMATKLDLQGALLGKSPCPSDDLWIRDQDIVVVPKSPVKRLDDALELLFTRGLYAIVPLQDVTLWNATVAGN